MTEPCSSRALATAPFQSFVSSALDGARSILCVRERLCV
jgi:hypothetical protein